MRLLGVLLLGVSLSICVPPGDTPALKRSAMIGAAVATPPDGVPGVVVTSVTPQGSAARAGLRANDRIVRVGETEINDLVVYARDYRARTGGETVRLEAFRDGRPVSLTLTYDPYPMESIPGVEIERGAVLSDAGHWLATVTAKPAAATGRLPAVLLVPWLSCSPVEMPSEINVGLRDVLHTLPRAGFLLYRVDKASVGDSLGPDCSDLDLDTELAGYRAAFRQFSRRHDVDPARLFLLGHSLGGALAPVIGAGQNVRGYVISGFPTRTWFEHMIDQERRRLALSAVGPAERAPQLRRFIDFYSRYLVRKEAPADILRDSPHLAGVWTEPPRHQYGRPYRFIQQVQDLNTEAAFAAVRAPTLVLYGEYDWLMSRRDHELAVEILNHQSPGRAELVILERADHVWAQHGSAAAAFRGETGRVDPTTTRKVVDWLRRASAK